MIEGSFDWRILAKKPNFVASPVLSFKHVALSRCWENLMVGAVVELRSPNCSDDCTNAPCCFWVGCIISVQGFIVQMRYLGFDDDDSHDVWINICTEPNLHPIGWCAENGMPMVPPKIIEEKHGDWKEYLVRLVSKVRTIPPDFATRVLDHKKNKITKGMKLEVVDKDLISAMRLATVESVVGGRLHIKYDGGQSDDPGFWCHEKSPLIHPIGWSRIIGHALKGNAEYAKQSLIKVLFRTQEPVDTTWDHFPRVPNPAGNFKFQPEMKLEAIDPLNLSTICVATVTEVLRNNYLMIGIDGMTESDGSDCFCYHASSPSIFPAGFCESNGIQLTPPRGYKGEFKWMEYLKKTKSKAAPGILFHREMPMHGFMEGAYLEAVDLMEPRLVCVAKIARVVGRLLRVHFEGWEESFDQWCDCDSPDIFPVGWCESVGYKLEPPREEGIADAKKSSKAPSVKPRRRRRRLAFTQRKRHTEDFEAMTIKSEPIDTDS